jgi:hypothetical protein
MNPTIIPIEPYWDKLQEFHSANKIKLDFWEWLKKEFGGYQVYIVDNPTSTGEKDASGLAFYEPSEATLFSLKWS